MTIAERIEADLQSAMKQKNELELSVLRLVRSAFKNKQIDLGHPLTDDEAQAVVKTLQKQYQDALVDFEHAGRKDLADRQIAELVVVKRYLPEAMPPEELERAVKDVLLASSFTSPADIGKAMGAVMKAVGGRADGNAVRAVVQRLLTPS
jgi:uncharacterized protein